MKKMSIISKILHVAFLGMMLGSCSIQTLSAFYHLEMKNRVLFEGNFVCKDFGDTLKIHMPLPGLADEVRSVTVRPFRVEIRCASRSPHIFPNKICVLSVARRLSTKREDYRDNKVNYEIDSKPPIGMFIMGKHITLTLPLEDPKADPEEITIQPKAMGEKSEMVDKFLEGLSDKKLLLSEHSEKGVVYFIERLPENPSLEKITTIKVSPHCIKRVYKSEVSIKEMGATTQSRLKLDREQIKAYIYKRNFLVVRVPKSDEDEPSIELTV